MKASFGGKNPYDNDYEAPEEFEIDLFTQEYQPRSAIHPERFGGSHFYIHPPVKNGVNQQSVKKKPKK